MSVAADLTASTWKVFSDLLDRGLELPVEQRAAWLDGLDVEHKQLKPALRSVLLRSGGAETAQWLNTLPRSDSPVPALDENDLQNGALVGPYRLLREIGVGGMGAVWLAERADGSLKRQVALKLPRASWSRGLAERMARERDILASLEHPNIARLYDAGTDVQGRPFLALEYVEGEPIDVYCRQRALNIKARLQLLLQVAQAVAFAHSRLVVHRDLKPSNILVTADGSVRLLDFGIAKLMEVDRTQETQLTQMVGRALTLDYASPEQIRGEPLGTASDVYSLGVVSYELLAGAKPYKLKRQTAAQLEEAIAAIDAPLASATATDSTVKEELKGDLDAILNKALKKNTNERYAIVDAFAQDIENHVAGRRVAARPDSTVYRINRFARRHRTPLSAAAIITVAFGLAIGVGATALVILVLLFGLGAAMWQAGEAQRQAEIAREQTRIAQTEARTAEEVQNFLEGIFRANTGDQADPIKGRQRTAKELLDEGAERIDAELASAPQAKLRVLGTLARMYTDLGEQETAARLRGQKSKIQATVTGEGSPEHIAALAEWAYALVDASRTQDASEVLARAYRLSERDSTRSAPGWKLDLALANLRITAGQDDAIAPAQRAVAALRALPPSHDLTQALELYGAALVDAGRFQEGRKILVSAIETAANLPAGGGSQLSYLMGHIGFADMGLGEYARAETFFREAIRRADAHDGPTSRKAAVARYDLGIFLGNDDRPVEGAKTLVSALRIVEDWPAAAPERSQYLPMFTLALARVETKAGRSRAALALLESARTLFDRQNQLPRDAMNWALAGAEVMLEVGLYDQAEAQLDTARDIARNLDVLAAILSRIDCLQVRLDLERGNLDYAEPRLLQLRSLQHYSVAQSLGLIVLHGEIHLARGRYESAAEVIAAALPILGDRGNDRVRAQLTSIRGRARLSLGHLDNAIEDLRDTVALWRRTQDCEQSVALANALVLLAEAYARVPRIVQADGLVVEAQRIFARYPHMHKRSSPLLSSAATAAMPP